MMAAANKLVRRGDRAGLNAAEGLFAEMAAATRERVVEQLFTPDYAGRLGFPGYELTNNGANIRRIKARIAALERTATRETHRSESGVRLVENAELNRVQLF